MLPHIREHLPPRRLLQAEEAPHAVSLQRGADGRGAALARQCHLGHEERLGVRRALPRVFVRKDDHSAAGAADAEHAEEEDSLDVDEEPAVGAADEGWQREVRGNEWLKRGGE